MNNIDVMTSLVAALGLLVLALQKQLAAKKATSAPSIPVPPPITGSSSTPNPDGEIYATAKAVLGTKQTLDANVPAEVGCGEAWSAVVKRAGVQGIPAAGFPGTATIFDWLSSNPAFELITIPEAGATIVSPTGHGNGSVEGHIGILGAFSVQFPGDWGICSNSSATGLWSEKWSLVAWKTYYTNQGGIPVYLFRWKGV